MRKGRMGFNPKWKQEARRKGETSSKVVLSVKQGRHWNTFRKRIEPIKEKVPKHVLEVIEEELANLDRKEADYGSTNRIYSYLDWLTALPWGKCSDENFDVLRAEKILDEDHYGLRVVKERILEFIAVGNLTGNPEGRKIICLSGPPGVGKTSIARSVARALGRKFFRLAVGGLSDSSEIKGDRRVYIAATPGKMVQCLKKVGTENPLVLLDEIDKLGKSRRDPEGAFLELLDPEQNAHFLDHFLDVPIDLSKVLFVCTANNIDRLPASAKAAMVDLDSSETAAEGSIELKNEYLRLADVLKVFEHAVDGGSTRVESREVAEKFTVDESNLSDYVGATPKDGPSAGCTMITSLLSLAMKKPIRKDLAMTGEVTLTGRILPIGGLKEKTMAARRSQVKVIIFPEANRRDFEGLEESVKERLDVHFVDEYEQIFELAFGDDH
ncbi:BnaC06g04230D [Brassica napus]|uniref:endopeptidase La n=1 Tax=Brassica napus TaxID=3708 RepID=A0A078GKT5_BRANA|nr:BnaC06g04230D [Brassica napus]